MLLAGAQKVYAIESKKEFYRSAFVHFHDLIATRLPVVCVSDGMSEHLRPAIIVVNLETDIEEYKTKHAVSSSTTVIYSHDFLNYPVNFLKNKIWLG